MEFTKIEEVSVDSIKEYCEKSDFFVIKINTNFDIQKMRKDVDFCIENYDFAKPKDFWKNDMFGNYRVLGLQYQKGDNDLYHNSRAAIRYISDDHKSIEEYQSPSDWSEWNEAGELLDYLRAPLDSIGIKCYRTRLLSCGASKMLPRHLDYDYR